MKSIEILNFLESVSQGTKISRGMKTNEDAVARLLVADGWTVERQVSINNMDVSGRKKSGHKVDIVASKGQEVMIVDVKSSGNSNTHGAPINFITQFVNCARAQFRENVKMVWMRVTDDVNHDVSNYADYEVFKSLGIEEVNAHKYFGVNINDINSLEVENIFNTALVQKMKNPKASWKNIKPIDIIIHIMKVFNISIDDIKKEIK
ncbi:hypothetical protein ACQ31_gp067 [Salmonella phage STML-198]|uniref:Uncharacterized protein n=1 Tax=Salmonella phage STML-198 TaxID=1204531 RepID=K4I5X0_9CAUD|nr:hypothetical protein ACQ31_gp067 [Salmonella phage STML-198]AFU63950.1 hypothetical protein [Salmonella phage STML-198]